jgi:hypothetical protein
MSVQAREFAQAKALAKKIAATMTRQEIADALNVSLDALDKMHQRGDGPPRFKSSPKRWCYPLMEFRAWQEARLQKPTAQSE